ncbi:hypothetical protein F5Y18DRAFT_424982 [Xylariaceae sp. FL1019]|nr:hypothetical protein F5Y18DRAFT_424982 [Xylariaceae sp. FL1019]
MARSRQDRQGRRRGQAVVNLAQSGIFPDASGVSATGHQMRTAMSRTLTVHTRRLACFERNKHGNYCHIPIREAPLRRKEITETLAEVVGYSRGERQIMSIGKFCYPAVIFLASSTTIREDAAEKLVNCDLQRHVSFWLSKLGLSTVGTDRRRCWGSAPCRFDTWAWVHFTRTPFKQTPMAILHGVCPEGEKMGVNASWSKCDLSCKIVTAMVILLLVEKPRGGGSSTSSDNAAGEAGVFVSA